MKKKILLILFLISLLTRAFFLFNGHEGITHDEADFYYNGYVVSKTGTDIFGNKAFFTTGIISATPNIPVYISSIFWNLTDKTSVIMARMPFALINSFTPLLLTLLIFAVSGNSIFSLLIFAIFNFSPWFLNISSTAGFDSPLALFFVLCSFLTLLKIKNRILRGFLFVLFNFLAFNSYMGYRVISPFSMTLQLIIANWKDIVPVRLDVDRIKKFSLYFLISIFLFFIFSLPTLILPNSDLLKTRALSENVFTNKDTLADVMWYASETSSLPLIGRIFSNKIFTPFALLLKSWLNTFNFSTFFGGETHPIYGMRILGLFFMTDIFLLILGIIKFREIAPVKLYPFLLILVFGGLPFALSPQGVTIALRGIMLLIPYSILIACGYCYLFFKHKRIFIICAVIFLVNIISVLLLYSFRIKVISSESYHYTDKQVIEDLDSLQEPVHVFHKEFRPFILLYSFYNSQNPTLYKKQLNNPKINIFINNNNTVYIYPTCDTFNLIKKGSLILHRPKDCKFIDSQIIKTYIAKDRSGEVLYNLIRR